MSKKHQLLSQLEFLSISRTKDKPKDTTTRGAGTTKDGETSTATRDSIDITEEAEAIIKGSILKGITMDIKTMGITEDTTNKEVTITVIRVTTTLPTIKNTMRRTMTTSMRLRNQSKTNRVMNMS